MRAARSNHAGCASMGHARAATHAPGATWAHARLRAAASVSSCLAALLAGGEVSAYQVKTTPSGALVRWPRASRPLILSVSSARVGSAKQALLDEALGLAIIEWNAASALQLELSNEPATAASALVVEWTDEVWESENGGLATTTIAYDSETGAIERARVRINDRFAWLDACGGEEGCPGGAAFDLAGTMTHELGHALGLGHSDVPDATMFLGAHAGQETKRTLDEDDLAAVRFLYGEPGAAVEEVPVGCSTGAPGPVAAALLALGWVGIVRGRGRAGHARRRASST